MRNILGLPGCLHLDSVEGINEELFSSISLVSMGPRELSYSELEEMSEHFSAYVTTMSGVNVFTRGFMRKLQISNVKEGVGILKRGDSNHKYPLRPVIENESMILLAPDANDYPEGEIEFFSPDIVREFVARKEFVVFPDNSYYSRFNDTIRHTLSVLGFSSYMPIFKPGVCDFTVYIKTNKGLIG